MGARGPGAQGWGGGGQGVGGGGGLSPEAVLGRPESGTTFSVLVCGRPGKCPQTKAAWGAGVAPAGGRGQGAGRGSCGVTHGHPEGGGWARLGRLPAKVPSVPLQTRLPGPA